MKDFLEKMKEFIKTPLGKLALVGVVLLILLFLAAFLVGIFFLFSSLRTTSKEASKVPVEIKKTSETATASAKKSTSETDTAKDEKPEELTSFEVYEYKDPFEPLITEESTGTPGSGDTTPTTPTTTPGDEGDEGEESSTGSGEETTGPQVLEVQDIYTENGTKYSSVKYGSSVHKVKEGDRVNESPYEVLTIGTDSVVFLYGDQRVQVSIGESILK